MASRQYVEGYTPAEAAELTGIGVVLQRDHRRRFPEWMPQASGHARFNLFQCLQMRFVADAGEFHIGPANAYAVGEWVAHSALMYALAEPKCIDGNLASECSKPGATDNDVREYTARRVFAEAFGRPRLLPAEFAFFWGDGAEWFGPSLEMCLASIPDGDCRRGKPMMALHLPSYARRLVAKLPRPAVRIVQGGEGTV